MAQDIYRLELTRMQLRELRIAVMDATLREDDAWWQKRYDALLKVLSDAQTEQDAMPPAMETIYDESGIAIGEARAINEATDIDLAIGGTCCD